MKRHIGKVVAFLVGLCIGIFGVFFQNVEQIHGMQEWLKALSNASFLSGTLLTGIGLLVLISKEGVFDGMKYATSSIWASLWNRKKRYATYYDYMKREKKRGGASSLLVPGLFYILFAVIFTVLFYI